MRIFKRRNAAPSEVTAVGPQRADIHADRVFFFAFGNDRLGNIVRTVIFAEYAEAVQIRDCFGRIGNNEVVRRGGRFGKSDFADFSSVYFNNGFLRIGVRFDAQAVIQVGIVVFVNLFTVGIEVFIVGGESNQVLCAAAERIGNAFRIRQQEIHFADHLAADRIERPDGGNVLGKL